MINPILERRRKRPKPSSGRHPVVTTGPSLLLFVCCLICGFARICSFSLTTRLTRFRQYRNCRSCTSLHQTQDGNHQDSGGGGGVFRPFADHAIRKLQETGWLQPLQNMPQDLKYKVGAAVPSSLYRQQHAPPRRDNVASPPQQDSLLLTNTTTTATSVPFGGIDYRVHISVTALEASSAYQVNGSSSPIQYARVVLMETLPTTTDAANSSSSSSLTLSMQQPPFHGLHALNIVVFPNNQTTLPVWGVSMATTVPSSRLPTMMTLDAQPMVVVETENHATGGNNSQTQQQQQDHTYASYFQDWYRRHVQNNPHLPWGGPLRPAVQPFMSDYVLWSKLPVTLSTSASTAGSAQDTALSNTTLVNPPSVMLQSPNETSATTTTTTPSTLPTKSHIDTIQQDVWDAYQEHLEIYLHLMQQEFNKNINSNNHMLDHPSHPNQQVEYCDYWRYNEPERSTMAKLFGKEWTERLLWQVMFPMTATNRSDNGNDGDDKDW